MVKSQVGVLLFCGFLVMVWSLVTLLVTYHSANHISERTVYHISYLELKISLMKLQILH